MQEDDRDHRRLGLSRIPVPTHHSTFFPKCFSMALMQRFKFSVHEDHHSDRGLSLSFIPFVTDLNISCNVNLNLNLIIKARYSGEKSNQGFPFYVGSENLKAKEEKKRGH